MPDRLVCHLSDAQCEYVLGLSDDTTLVTEAFNTLDGAGWSEWVGLARGIAGMSAHVRDNHGADVAYGFELMLIKAQIAPLVLGWSSADRLRLYEPINGYWRV